MIDVPLQWTGKVFEPFSPEAMEESKGFHRNQVVRAKITGVKKPRSYQQLKLYWACCRTVANNREDVSPEDVDFEVKVNLKHIKAFRIVNGATMIEVDSISYDRLEHLEACNFFDRAFPVMARMIGVKVDDLLAHAHEDN